MILKPQIMRQPSFDPYDFSTYSQSVERLTLHITIISARHLIKPSKGIASPFVEVEIVGVEDDNGRYKTKTVQVCGGGV